MGKGSRPELSPQAEDTNHSTAHRLSPEENQKINMRAISLQTSHELSALGKGLISLVDMTPLFEQERSLLTSILELISNVIPGIMVHPAVPALGRRRQEDQEGV